jgi:hypothetical protein
MPVLAISAASIPGTTPNIGSKIFIYEIYFQKWVVNIKKKALIENLNNILSTAEVHLYTKVVW